MSNYKKQGDVLALCREQKNYPPVLPQFVESCKAAQAHRVAPHVRETVRVSSQEIAERHLAEMMKKLKNS